jgi:hypothetical protein
LKQIIEARSPHLRSIANNVELSLGERHRDKVRYLQLRASAAERSALPGWVIGSSDPFGVGL